MTGIEQAIQKAGEACGDPRRARSAFARHLGISVQVVGQWLKRGWLPPQRALEVEELYGVDRALLVKPSLRALVGEPLND